MDLGATLCRRSRPNCPACPLYPDCGARRQGNPTAYPGKRPKKALPQRAVHMLLVRDQGGALLLERRPPSGVWGGLWCLPEIGIGIDPLDWCARELRQTGTLGRRLAARRHTFSHFHLDIEPVEILLNGPGYAVLEGAGWLWYNPGQPENIGLAAPVARLIDEVSAGSNQRRA